MLPATRPPVRTFPPSDKLNESRFISVSCSKKGGHNGRLFTSGLNGQARRTCGQTPHRKGFASTPMRSGRPARCSARCASSNHRPPAGVLALCGQV
jgi:hypothetical protein